MSGGAPQRQLFRAHGGTATIAGEHLSGLALGVKDEGTRSPFCVQPLPHFRPEPFRKSSVLIERAGPMADPLPNADLNAEALRQAGTDTLQWGAAFPALLGKCLQNMQARRI